ncbi:MAG: DedA family protein [Actinobacteria bacterium]|nr:DedA family protein [Actinomycetota bacterium]
MPLHVVAPHALLEFELSTWSAVAIYALCFTIVFIESGLLIGFFLPGDSVLFAAGLLSSDPAKGLNFWVLAIGIFLCAFVGDQVGYVTGRKLGRPWLESRTSARSKKVLGRTERFYDRFGWFAVVIARYIPWVRTFIPFVAGIGRMNYYRFLSANVTGALCWGVGITALGHWSGRNEFVRYISYGIALFFIVLSLVKAVRWWVEDRREQRGATSGEA